MNGLGFGRRMDLRADVHAVVSISRDGRRWLGPFPVENLSGGGALILGHTRLNVGDDAHLRLHLPGCEGVHFQARVLRISDDLDGQQRLAVAFVEPDHDVEESIRKAVARSLGRGRSRDAAVLVVERCPVDGERLATDLQQLGRKPLVAKTPLEIIHRLQDPRCRVKAALIDLSTLDAAALQVLRFMADAFPFVRRVILGRDQAELEQASTQAHAVMLKPWTHDDLAGVIAGVDDWRETFASAR